MLLTERIRELSEPLNLTFASIERAIGIGRGTIRKWDKNCPSADKLLKVANLLQTSMEYLLTGKETIQHQTAHSSEDQEWLSLIHQLPIEKQYEFKGELKGYIRHMEETAATESSNEGTMGKSLA